MHLHLYEGESFVRQVVKIENPHCTGFTSSHCQWIRIPIISKPQNTYKNVKNSAPDTQTDQHPTENMPPPVSGPPQIPHAALIQEKQGSAVMIWAIGAFVYPSLSDSRFANKI